MSYPMLQLTNGVLDMRIYTPDREAGFYRGVRFDWSGIIERVEYKGHRFYGPWRSAHQSTGNDFVSGPAGEFAMDAPMGFDEAAPGHHRSPKEASTPPLSPAAPARWGHRRRTG